MTHWRQGESVPHHVYRQLGDEPDTRPWPDGDPPVASFLDPDDAELCVRAVEAERARYEPHASIGLDRSASSLIATCKCGVSETFPAGADADARTWWERHGRAAGHALDYRAGFDDGVRYARGYDAMTARMLDEPADEDVTLAEAIGWVQRYVDNDAGPWRKTLGLLLDDRERAWCIAGGGRCVACGEVVTLAQDGTLTPHVRDYEGRGDSDDEQDLCDGSDTRNHEPPNILIRVDRAAPPSDMLLAVEMAARNLFRAICHEHDERGETFPVRVSLRMDGLRQALGEEYPPMAREET